MDYKVKQNGQCRCPVCNSMLGYLYSAKRRFYYCDECEWTFEYKGSKTVKPAHKGKPAWNEFDPYVKED